MSLTVLQTENCLDRAIKVIAKKILPYKTFAIRL